MTWPHGESALVTGAASGMGLGISRALVAAGAKVALVDINAERLEAVAKELTDAGATVTTLAFDISKAEEWEAAADRAEAAIGPISIVCSNAGVSGNASVDDTTFAVWRWVHSINLDAQFLAVETFLPRFRARGGRSHFMSTSSMAGICPMTNVSAYVSSKFASLGFAMVLRDELAGSDISVSVLCPGAVATDLARNDNALREKMLGIEGNPEAVELNSAALSTGADPNAVGAQVVEAMQNKQFLIVTHKEWKGLVAKTHDEIMATFDAFDGRHGVDNVPLGLLSGEYAASA